MRASRWLSWFWGGGWKRSVVRTGRYGGPQTSRDLLLGLGPGWQMDQGWQTVNRTVARRVVGTTRPKGCSGGSKEALWLVAREPLPLVVPPNPCTLVPLPVPPVDKQLFRSHSSPFFPSLPIIPTHKSSKHPILLLVFPLAFASCLTVASWSYRRSRHSLSSPYNTSAT